MSTNNKKFLYGYEWNNAFDNCLYEDKFYTFGSYIDLCGMSIEDALKAQNSCNGDSGSSSSDDDTTEKTENILYITLEEEVA